MTSRTAALDFDKPIIADQAVRDAPVIAIAG
jgi:hypothetical protein